MYLTEHPTDLYPKAEICIDDTPEGETTIMGVITNLTIKKRKADGKEMAFFSLEDRSGSIEVAMFTKVYASYNKLVKAGAVVEIVGRCEYEEVEAEETEGEESEIETVKKFIASSVNQVDILKTSLAMSVQTIDVWNEIATDIKEQYEDASGSDMLIYIESEDRFEAIPFKVSDAIRSLPKVKEIRTNN